MHRPSSTPRLSLARLASKVCNETPNPHLPVLGIVPSPTEGVFLDVRIRLAPIPKNAVLEGLRFGKLEREPAIVPRLLSTLEVASDVEADVIETLFCTGRKTARPASPPRLGPGRRETSEPGARLAQASRRAPSGVRGQPLVGAILLGHARPVAYLEVKLFQTLGRVDLRNCAETVGTKNAQTRMAGNQRCITVPPS